MRTFITNLRKAADLCAPFGVALLIEPHNLRDNPNYLLRTLAEAREVIGRVERANLRIVFMCRSTRATSLGASANPWILSLISSSRIRRGETNRASANSISPHFPL